MPQTTDRPAIARETGTRPFQVEIRPPANAELRACRMILPEAFQHGVAPDLLLAVEPERHRFAGAIAYSAALFTGALAWRFQLHVVRGYRRRGIGRSLVDALASRAAEQSVTALVGIQPEQAADGPQFLAAIGCAPSYRSSVYVGEIANYDSTLRPLVERVRARRWAPDDVRSLTLGEAPREQLLAFLKATALHEPHHMDTHWEDLWRRPSVRESSVVLLQSDDIVGVIMAERRGTLVDVIWRVVAPAYRRGWANVLLTAAMWDRMVETGVTHMKFATTSDTPDTERAVRLYGIQQAYRLDHYVRRLT